MSNRRRITDPRHIAGEIAGPGGPHDRGSVIIDASKAVLLDTTTVATIDDSEATFGEMAVALLLEGRINQTKDRARVLFVVNSDACAVLITELVALFGRAGKVDAGRFLSELTGRVDKLRAEGNLS